MASLDDFKGKTAAHGGQVKKHAEITQALLSFHIRPHQQKEATFKAWDKRQTFRETNDTLNSVDLN